MLQDCGKPWYRENYIAFFEALRFSYPHLRLIANCDMGDGAPTDLYDWHVYTGASGTFHHRSCMRHTLHSAKQPVTNQGISPTTSGHGHFLMQELVPALDCRYCSWLPP